MKFNILIILILFSSIVIAGNAIDIEFMDKVEKEETIKIGDVMVFTDYEESALIIDNIQENIINTRLVLSNNKVWGVLKIPLLKETEIDIDRDNEADLSVLIKSANTEEIVVDVKRLKFGDVTPSEKNNSKENDNNQTTEEQETSTLIGIIMGIVIIIIGLSIYYKFVKK